MRTAQEHRQDKQVKPYLLGRAVDYWLGRVFLVRVRENETPYHVMVCSLDLPKGKVRLAIEQNGVWQRVNCTLSVFTEISVLLEDVL